MRIKATGSRPGDVKKGLMRRNNRRTAFAAWLLFVFSLSVQVPAEDTQYIGIADQGKHGERVFNPNPGAQWYRNGNMGLFIHWGIASVTGVELSWGMLRDSCELKCTPENADVWPVEKYYAQAGRFNPDHFDPDTWLAAAKKAGMTYAVLTTRHHDGYALWPSAYGDLNTKNYMGGRDLVGEYVAACRRQGMKVGFYYSPLDWHFCPEGYPWAGYPRGDKDFTYSFISKQKGMPRPEGAPYSAEMQHIFDTYFYPYVKGQVRELMTRYGKIDLIWWDGFDWPNGLDVHKEELLGMVRELQPQIVINPRYDTWGSGYKGGDYATVEGAMAKHRPEAAVWERCANLRGYWGYTPTIPDDQGQSPAGVIEEYARIRTWGGNSLPNIGPKPDGTLPQYFYDLCDALAEWRSCNGEAFDGTSSGPYPEQSSRPVTTRGEDIWYVLSDPVKYPWRWSKEMKVPQPVDKIIELKSGRKVKSATLLKSGEPVDVSVKGDAVTLNIPANKADTMQDVVKVCWE